MTTTRPADLWPTYRDPGDLAAIEAVPLTDRGLPDSTFAVLTRARDLWPDRPAVTVLPSAVPGGAVTWTFEELCERTVRIANVFTASGIGRHAAVGLLSPNVAELIPALLAAEAVGIAAPANPALHAEDLAHLFGRAGVQVLIAAGPEIDPGIWATARRLGAELGITAVYALRPTDAVGQGPALDQLPGVEVGYLCDIAAQHPDDVLTVGEPAGADLAAVFHTGGTTGRPKLAAHSHSSEVADAWMIAANSLLENDSVLFAALPLFHVNALVVTLLAPLLRGQHVVWAGPLGYRDPELVSNLWKLVERYGIATMSGVPTVYSMLATIPVDADISSLRFAIVGASALPPAVSEAFTAHTGVALLEGYGLTEGTCASARNLPGHPRPGSVGQRLPYQRVKIVAVRSRVGPGDDPRRAAGTRACR